MRPNVLYLSYDGLTDPLGQSQILPYVLGLEKKGYEFYLISFEKKEAFINGEAVIRSIIGQARITWYPQLYHKNPPIVSTVIDLWRMYGCAKTLAIKQSIVLVHCRSYIPGLIGLRLKLKFGVKFLFDIRGFWANERVDGGLWNLKNPVYQMIYRFFKKKEIEMMQHADHIISLTHAGKEEIVSGRLFEGAHLPIPANKVSVIPCSVDLELFDPEKIDESEKNLLKQSLGLVNVEEVFVYLGSLGTWYLLDEMLIYFKTALMNQPNSKFLFVTKEDPQLIHAACDQVGLDLQSIIIRSANRDQVPLYLSIGTKGIFFIKPAYSKKASSAVKMGEMLAMGLDLVCNKFGDINLHSRKDKKQFFSQFDCVEINNDHKEKVIAEFSLKNGINSFVYVYNQLIEKSNL